MKEKFRRFIEGYHTLPESSLSVTLLGCELFVVFSIFAMLLPKAAHLFSDPCRVMSIADALGAAGQRVLVLSIMTAIAIGLAGKILELRKQR